MPIADWALKGVAARAPPDNIRTITVTRINAEIGFWTREVPDKVQSKLEVLQAITLSRLWTADQYR
jgi:hypothetical protein